MPPRNYSAIIAPRPPLAAATCIAPPSPLLRHPSPIPVVAPHLQLPPLPASQPPTALQLPAKIPPSPGAYSHPSPRRPLQVHPAAGALGAVRPGPAGADPPDHDHRQGDQGHRVNDSLCLLHGLTRPTTIIVKTNDDVRQEQVRVRSPVLSPLLSSRLMVSPPRPPRFCPVAAPCPNVAPTTAHNCVPCATCCGGGRCVLLRVTCCVLRAVCSCV